MANQRTSATTWRERVAQWRDSGQPGEVYAKQRGWPDDRLKYWARRVERESQGVEMVPVRIQPPVNAADVQLRGPSGWTLTLGRGCDPTWLAALLAGLR